MNSKDFLQARERALENEYFRRRDQELITELRRQGSLERDRRALGEELAIVDPNLLSRLQGIGFSADNLELLHLVPMVEVAWAEGDVTAREREMILALAERRGIDRDSPVYQQLVGWLENEPTSDFYETALDAIRATLDGEDETAREADLKDLVEWSIRIAEATGGILGMAKVCREERECLQLITERLTAEQEADAVGRLASILKP
jgi:hypothetical protein